jgi:hypothetical protein
MEPTQQLRCVIPKSIQSKAAPTSFQKPVLFNPRQVNTYISSLKLVYFEYDDFIFTIEAEIKSYS